MRQLQDREYIVEFSKKRFFQKNEEIDSNFVVAKTRWSSVSENKLKKKLRKTYSITIKISKVLIYSFLLLMGLWGCFQTMIEPEVKTSLDIGSGLEFGFLTGTTDFRYLLARSSGEYFAFSSQNWTMEYGPFYGLFIWPGASLVLEIMFAFRDAWGGMNALLAILTLVLIIRVLTLAVSLRSVTSSERMQEIQPRIAEIKAKYKDLKDMNSRRAQQIEVNNVYQKYNVKPFAPFEQIFITLPIFLIIFRVVTILRPLKDTSLFEIWNFSEIPMTEIFNNFEEGWVYIFFLLLIIPIQILSQRLPQILSRKRSGKSFQSSTKGKSEMKKTKIMQLVIMVVLAFVVISSASGVGVYWGLSSLFSIGQTLFIHWLFVSKGKKAKNASIFFKEIGLE